MNLPHLQLAVSASALLLQVLGLGLQLRSMLREERRGPFREER